MTEYIVLYNPLSGSEGTDNSHLLDELLPGVELRYMDITTIDDYSEFFKSIPGNTPIAICGGDGTINRFINATENINYKNPIFYYPCGTGNDFMRDIAQYKPTLPVLISEYITGLPTVCVNGKRFRFLNNVGFGIDGYCTQVGDEMRASHKDKINYTAIAIKGLLGAFHPVDASVLVDGVEKHYRNVWLVPTMKGRYYGGGMMPAPSQSRNAEDSSVSVMVFHTRSRLKALLVFPSIFKGTHIKHKNMVTVLNGHHIHVSFSRPCPLQIDGETIRNVTEYDVFAG